MAISEVGVVGCGTMGAGIAQVSAASGYRVSVVEVSEEALERGLQRVRDSLERAVGLGKISEGERQKVLANLKGGVGLRSLDSSDLVIEAVFEDIEVKRKLFRELDALCPEKTLFASNTSSLSITEMAGATQRPDRFVGMHFFNPAPVMKLVEVVRGMRTSQGTLEAALGFVRSLGKEPILSLDRPGFIVDRLLVPYLMEAVRALEEGVGTVEDIDKGMRLGCGYPMGPFALLDLVGLDIAYQAAKTLYEEFRERTFAPPPLLKRMVQAGLLGRKTGKGFYEYPREKGKT